MCTIIAYRNIFNTANVTAAAKAVYRSALFGITVPLPTTGEDYTKFRFLVAPECRDPFGIKYIGSENKTESGDSCVPWSERSTWTSSNYLHAPFDSFTDEDWARQENYCRQVNGINLWCFTASGWGMCDVPICQSEFFSIRRLISFFLWSPIYH